MGLVSIAKTNKGIKNGLVKALDLLGGLKEFVSYSDR